LRNIIVISGKQGSGKSTQAEMLQAIALKDGFVPLRVRFSEVLYELHNVCLPLLKKYGIRDATMEKDGELLQVLGTEYGRKLLGDDVWIKVLRRRVDYWLRVEPHLIIIDDCRFENEHDAFSDALRVHLECTEEMRKARCSYWRTNTNHPSEIGLDNYIASGRFAEPWCLRLETDRTEPKVTAHLIWNQFRTMKGLL